MLRNSVLAAALASLMFSGSSHAAFVLQVSEIWPGNEPGSNLTDDWFEVTNVGDMAWTAAVDGDLYFDDDSANYADADRMSGVASIAAGESVIFVDGLATDWLVVWGPLPSLQVGEYAGSGLSQGGDAVSLFLDAGFDGVDSLDLIGVTTYPDATGNGGQSYDVSLAAFSTVGNASGAFATIILNDEGQAGIGSPGSVAAVPLPAAFWLFGTALLSLAGLRKSRRA